MKWNKGPELWHQLVTRCNLRVPGSGATLLGDIIRTEEPQTNELPRDAYWRSELMRKYKNACGEMRRASAKKTALRNMCLEGVRPYVQLNACRLKCARVG